MQTISAVVIVKNAEDLIADCLDSLDFCDEIIVIDGGSTDRTADIAKKQGAKIYPFSSNDFSALRNHGLQKATGDWILYVDADERVTKELTSSIKNVLQKDSQVLAYRVKRKNFYFGNHEWPTVEQIERLFRRTKLKGWYGLLHESPKIDGEIGDIDGFLYHYTHRDLSSMIEKTLEWSKIEATLRYESNHPKMSWWRFPRVMIFAFYDSYIKQKGWKAGAAGLVESMYQAFSIFITYARLWEMQIKGKNQNEKRKITI